MTLSERWPASAPGGDNDLADIAGEFELQEHPFSLPPEFHIPMTTTWGGGEGALLFLPHRRGGGVPRAR